MSDPKDERKTHEMNPDTIFPPSEAEYSILGDALHQDEIQEGGVGTVPGPKEGMRRYPTDEPDSTEEKG